MKRGVIVVVVIASCTVSILAVSFYGRLAPGRERGESKLDALPEAAIDEELVPGDLVADPSAERMPIDSLDSGAPELDPVFARLLETFPELGEIKKLVSDEMLKPSWGRSQSSEQLGEGPVFVWIGNLDENEERTGAWVRWKPEGFPTMITYYESGRMVPPVIALHEGGAIKAYYPRLDEIRAVQGLGWWWYPDGKPHAAIHWEKSQKSGPALFLAPDGSVDRENTKIYALTE